MVLYFGHELTELGGADHDAMDTGRPASVSDLASGLRALAGDSTRVDLLVLGTCFGGTPYTIGALGPYARYIVALPDNLYLSYFNLEPLAGLGARSSSEELPALVLRFARNAFQQLDRDVQTTVSVVAYDTDAVRAYTQSVADDYERGLSVLDQMKPAPVEPCDCAEDSSFVRPGMDEGLTVFYRAARFGRAKHTSTHSGWECWRLAPQPNRTITHSRD